MKVNNSSDNKFVLFKKEIGNLSKFEEKLYEIYINEYDELFFKILIKTEDEFINDFNERVYLILEDMYGSDIYNQDKMLSIMENCFTKVTDVYKKDSQFLKDNFKPILKKKLVVNFNKHCKHGSNIPTHSCGGKFYPIQDDKQEIKFMVCLSCKMAYQKSSILMNCDVCNCDFYTSLLSNNENMDLVPATWEKYHCSAVLIIDQMRCLKCKGYLFLDIKKNLLVCKICRSETDPKTIVWICRLCEEKFKTDAKVYNELEYKLIKLAIKEALLYKQHSKPTLLPCCNGTQSDNQIDKKCIDMNEITFFHKKECNGKLYQSDLIKGRRIVVCEKCKMMNDYDKFIWTCPLCLKRFKQKPKTDDSSININHLICVKRSETERKTLPPYHGNNKDLIDKTELSKHSSSASSNNLADYVHEPTQYKKKVTNPPFIVNKNLGEVLPLQLKLDKETISSTASTAPDSSRKYNSSKTTINTNVELQEASPVSNKIATPSKGIGLIKLLEKGTNNLINQSNTDFKAIVDKGKIYSPEGIRDSKSQSQKATRKISSDKITYNNVSDFTETNISIMDKVELANKELLETNKQDIKEFDLDDYKVQNQIGEGSYGKIYLVTNKKNNSQFSLKKIIASEQDEIDQIYKEYELVNAVTHSGILKIQGICYKKLDSTTFALYVLMDLAKCDWDKEIKTRQLAKNYYKEDELVLILCQIVSSLSFLQNKNISHRDIKPQNILAFENMVYKIADFGEAKELVRRKYNQTDTLRGTELFMSPILFYALQNNKYDIKHNCYKSDIYSLGLSMVYATALVYNPIYEIRGSSENSSILATLNKYFKNKYSGKYINLLAKMLDYNENTRPDFIQLKEFLKNNY